jgi:hypothetical protein
VRKSVIAALAVVLLAGAALLAVPVLERHAASRIEADLERDGSTKVGSVEVGLFDRRITLKDLESRRFGEITIGRWEASGLTWPIAELAQGRTPFSGVALGDPFHAGHLELRDLRMTEGNTRWSIGALSISDFRLDRYDAAVAPGQFVPLAARIAGALSMGRLEQKGTTLTNMTSGNRFIVDDLVIERYEKGLFGSLTVAGFDFTAKPPHDPAFRIADVKATELDFRRAVTAMSATGWRPGAPIGRVDVGSASLSGFSGEAMDRYGVSLGAITQQSRLDKDVRHSTMRVEGLVMRPPSRTGEGLQLRVALASMGLKELKLEAECAGTEDRARGEFSVDRCAVTGSELGEASFSLKLVQADAPFWAAIDEGNTFLLLGSKAGIGGARIAIVDRGVVERTIKAVATTSGRPPTEVRAEMAQEVRRYQPPGILITEELSKLLDTVARFIERGGTLTLEAKPDSPIGIDKIQYFTRPGPDLVSILGLSATLAR